MKFICPNRVSDSTSTQFRGIGAEATNIDTWNTSSIEIDALSMKPVLA